MRILLLYICVCTFCICTIYYSEQVTTYGGGDDLAAPVSILFDGCTAENGAGGASSGYLSRTRTHTRAHARTHPPSHTQTHTHARTHARTHTKRVYNACKHNVCRINRYVARSRFSISELHTAGTLSIVNSTARNFSGAGLLLGNKHTNMTQAKTSLLLKNLSLAAVGTLWKECPGGPGGSEALEGFFPVTLCACGLPNTIDLQGVQITVPEHAAGGASASKTGEPGGREWIGCQSPNSVGYMIADCKASEIEHLQGHVEVVASNASACSAGRLGAAASRLTVQCKAAGGN